QGGAGEIPQAVEGRIGGGERQGDAGGGKERELPVVRQRLVDAVPHAVVAEQQEQHQTRKQEWVVLAYDRDDAVRRRLDVEPHPLLSRPAHVCRPICRARLTPTVMQST